MIGFSTPPPPTCPSVACSRLRWSAPPSCSVHPNENTPILLEHLGSPTFSSVSSWGSPSSQRPRSYHSLRRRHFFWVLITKRWRDAFRLFHPAALVSFCSPPYLVHPTPPQPGLLPHLHHRTNNFKRYLTPEFQHIQPFCLHSNSRARLVAVGPRFSSASHGLDSQLERSSGFFFGLCILLGQRFQWSFSAPSKSKFPGVCFAVRFPSSTLTCSFNFRRVFKSLSR